MVVEADVFLSRLRRAGVNPTTVSFVGCGAVADRYAEGVAAANTLRLAATVDRVADRAERVATEYGSEDIRPEVYTDLDSMLASTGVDLVLNLTPAGAHAGVTRACLEADRHVYSEKPLATDAETAREVLALAEDRDLGLGCAPQNHRGDPARVVAQYVQEGRLGVVRVAQATAHVGRPTEWHPNPTSVLRSDPLVEGGVYPLSLLTAMFGPVERVHSADAETLRSPRAVDGEAVTVDGPDHVTATLALADGLRVELTASTYVPHRAKRFYDLELFGDDGSLSLADAGAHAWNDGSGDDPPVEFARAGGGYRPVALGRPPSPVTYADGVVDLARAIEAGKDARAGARRAAHVVAVVEAVHDCATVDGPVTVDAPVDWPESLGRSPGSGPGVETGRSVPSHGVTVPTGPAMPPVGFGCSRFRDGTYVDRRDSIAEAIDAGYRLLDSAELYGNEGRIGDLLDAPGSPDREAVYLVSKVWNTNHHPDHVRAACAATRSRLGVDRLDAYLVHWPDAWAHRGHLGELADRPLPEQEALTFPETDDGDRATADVPLERTWKAMEDLLEAGATRAIGVCNVDGEELAELCATASHPPDIVQVERHPYRPNTAVVDRCREREIAVMAHSPLSAEGLLSDPTVADVAERHGLTPAGAVLRWNVQRGVVPIPSSTTPAHVRANLRVFDTPLSEAGMNALDGLATTDDQLG